jgi:hypothetical protein
MARSIWKRTLITLFASAGLAWAQQPIASSDPRAVPAQSAGHTFTVQEPGKVGQKCKVLKTWKTADGKTAYQVQAVNTGEMMTILESGPVTNLPSSGGSQVHAVATRIFHWGSDMKPPAGTPVPPFEDIHSMPPAMPVREPAKITSAAQPESAKPPVRPRPPDRMTAAWPGQEALRTPAMAQLEPPKQPPVVVSSEPAKPGFFSRLFFRNSESRASQTQVSASQDYLLNPVPLSQPVTATQNRTGLPANASTSPSLTDRHIGTLPQSSPLQGNTGSSLLGQPKTTAPDNRFSATPITQPKASFQDTWTTQPRMTGQDKPSAAPDKTSGTSTPRTAVSSPYYPTAPANSGSAGPQGSITPQRAVQVVPPGNGGTLPKATTNFAVPAASAPKLDGQAVPLAPASSALTSPATEKKPAGATMNSIGQSSKPLPIQSNGSNATYPFKPAPAIGTDSKTVLPRSTTWPPPAAQSSPTAAYKPSMSNPTPPSGGTAPVKPAPAIGTDSKSVLPGSTTWPPPAAQSPATSTYKSSLSLPTTSPYSATVPPAANTAGTKAPATGVPSTLAWPSSTNQQGGSAAPKLIDAPKPSTTMAPSTSTTTGKPASTAAPAIDWRSSWGKANDVAGRLSEKPIDSQPAPAKPALPHADTTRPDPLRMPQQFDRRPLEEKPSAQKRDSTLSTTSAAVSTLTAKPARSSVSETATARPLVGNAPVPASMNGSAGVAGTARAPTMTNASAPAPLRQSLPQANAFNTVPPAGSSAASAHPMATTSPASMIAQVTPAVGTNGSMNSTVITAGFQGPALANPSAPAAYQTMSSKPTPENIQQMLVALRDSLYPSQRELAAQSMAAADWRTHPQVVQALTTAAKEDPAATVRAGCVRCLANMKASTPPVVLVVRGLKNDNDPRVRQEAERALSILASGEK